VGVSGVCQSGVEIIAARFIGPHGGHSAQVVEALNYLLGLKLQYNLNLVATSFSYATSAYSKV
jgi:hypothetical protein